jgi:hypothetical protein
MVGALVLITSGARHLMLPAGGTQVKWNRLDGNILASSHLNEVLIWDRRVSELLSPPNVTLSFLERVYAGEKYQGSFGKNLRH